jgi:hypothetical protein
MRITARQFVAIASLVAMIAILPSGAGAVGYEDSLDDCSYPQTFDLMVMRPVGLVTMGLGAALYIPALPLTLLTSPGDLGTTTENLIKKPTRFTFRRGLGECSGVTIAY